jgi:hypothetical protein
MKNFLITIVTTLIMITLLATACGGAEPAAPTSTPPPPTPTPAPPTPAPATATPTPAAAPTPEVALEKVTLDFQTTVPSIEDAEAVLHSLEEQEGVKDGIASEDSLTVRYDPELITVEEIREFVERQGFPLK